MAREVKEADLATCLIKVLCYLELCIVAASRIQENREINDWNVHCDRVAKVVESQFEVIRYQTGYICLAELPSPHSRY